MAEWEVETTPDGTFDVKHNGRAVMYDAEDLEEASREVRRRGGREFILIEDDGYRTTQRC